MTIQLDNNQRKFHVQTLGFMGQQDIICNLNHIPSVVRSFEKNTDYKIYELWNRKWKLVSKKKLMEYYEANQLKTA